MHPNLTYIIAQQHVEDLRRVADHDRLARDSETGARRRTVIRVTLRRRMLGLAAPMRALPAEAPARGPID
jgi:hypothetical protein